MSATAEVPTVAAAPRAAAPWLSVGAALFAVAWGGNEFTPLLVMYRQIDHMSALTVNVLLGAYVLGIVPALLWAVRSRTATAGARSSCRHR